LSKIKNKSNVSSAWPCVIKPGETSTSGGLISILYDFHRPGKYTIQVSRPVWGDDQRPQTEGMTERNPPEIKSNTIIVTVLPADDKSPVQK